MIPSTFFKLLQCNLTILALCIGKPIFAVTRNGLVTTGELKDVSKADNRIVLSYTADIAGTEESMELTDIESLRSESGSHVLFGRRFLATCRFIGCGTGHRSDTC